jgi:hypothetical protein
MELPFHLQTLEPLPGALDIIRFLGARGEPDADVDAICQALDMSDRRFNKAIRRLVTKGYVQMVGDMTYTLTRDGRAAATTLAQYDGTFEPSTPAAPVEASGETTARLVVAVPKMLTAQRPNKVIVGIDGDGISTSGELVVRLSVLNGDPFQPVDAIFTLEGEPIQYVYEVTPDAFDQVRIRVQVYQLGPNPDDISVSGGLYVDAGVSGSTAGGAPMIAYGSDIKVLLME